MWRNFQFPHNCPTWKAEISPHDNFFSTNNTTDISDKYQVCSEHVPNLKILPLSILEASCISERMGAEVVKPCVGYPLGQPGQLGWEEIGGE